jgi:hypothetical protein
MGNKTASEYLLSQPSDYKKLSKESIEGLVGALDNLETGILNALFVNGALNTRSIHFQIVNRLYTDMHNNHDISDEDFNRFEALWRTNRTQVYTELIKRFVIPTYPTVKNRLVTLADNHIVARREAKDNRRIVTLWFLNPNIQAPYREMRESIISQAHDAVYGKSAQYPDAATAKRFGIDLTELLKIFTKSKFDEEQWATSIFNNEYLAKLDKPV